MQIDIRNELRNLLSEIHILRMLINVDYEYYVSTRKKPSDCRLQIYPNNADLFGSFDFIIKCSPRRDRINFLLCE